MSSTRSAPSAGTGWSGGATGRSARLVAIFRPGSAPPTLYLRAAAPTKSASCSPAMRGGSGSSPSAWFTWLVSGPRRSPSSSNARSLGFPRPSTVCAPAEIRISSRSSCARTCRKSTPDQRYGGRRHWHPQHGYARHSKPTQMVCRLTAQGDEMEIHVLKREARAFRT